MTVPPAVAVTQSPPTIEEETEQRTPSPAPVVVLRSTPGVALFWLFFQFLLRTQFVFISDVFSFLKCTFSNAAFPLRIKSCNFWRSVLSGDVCRIQCCVKIWIEYKNVFFQNIKIDFFLPINHSCQSLSEFYFGPPSATGGMWLQKD